MSETKQDWDRPQPHRLGAFPYEHDDSLLKYRQCVPRPNNHGIRVICLDRAQVFFLIIGGVLLLIHVLNYEPCDHHSILCALLGNPHRKECIPQQTTSESIPISEPSILKLDSKSVVRRGLRFATPFEQLEKLSIAASTFPDDVLNLTSTYEIVSAQIAKSEESE